MDYNAPPTLGKFLGSDDPNRLIVGPVGSGKSSVCCVEIVRRSIETPPGEDGVRRSRWVVVRNTYRELEDTTIKTWKEWVPEGKYGEWNQGDNVFTIKFETDAGAKVEAEVMFRALDRPDHVKKLLSLELTGCYFNEWKEIPRPIFQVMKTRVGRYPRREDVPRYWSGIFGDTNPPDTDHYLYVMFEEDRPQGHRVFKQPGGRSKEAENVENLARCWAPEVPEGLRGDARKDFIRDARAEQTRKIKSGEHEDPCKCYYTVLCQGERADFIKVMADGEYGFVIQGKPIYPEFQDSIHTANEAIPLLPNCTLLIIGNDYGLTPAAVWVQQDPSDGQYQVIREFVSERLGAVHFGEEQALICKKEFKTVKAFEGWGDPAGMGASPIDEQDTPINIVAAKGVPMVAAPTNDPVLRREAVAGLLTRLTMRGRPALVISPTCRVLRKGMAGGYCYRRLKVSGDERFEEKPLKNHYSHVCEALQYAMVGAGEDSRALDGGQPRRVSVSVRVHRSVGPGPARGEAYSDDEDLPFRVRSSVTRRR
jgi:hypothetical protein